MSTRTFYVHMNQVASATVTVKLDDERLAKVARDIGVEVGDLTLEDLREYVTDEAFDYTPRICAQCSGWGNDRVSLSLDGDWEVDSDAEGNELPNAVQEVTK